jgi:hypothetical protein
MSRLSATLFRHSSQRHNGFDQIAGLALRSGMLQPGTANQLVTTSALCTYYLDSPSNHLLYWIIYSSRLELSMSTHASLHRTRVAIRQRMGWRDGPTSSEDRLVNELNRRSMFLIELMSSYMIGDNFTTKSRVDVFV